VRDDAGRGGDRGRGVPFEGVIAALLGLITLGFGVVLVLRPLQQALLVAPVGAGALVFGVQSLRRPAGRAARVLAWVGLVSGALGAVLIVVGLLRSALSF
jgi:hypothetical protein